ncbi:MAG: hypothetical protein CMG00_03260 [Candidatus Marinimicrobia bacterium]|nr:hypothetical protein [Candidatus Neomarinimicrobiota bacterium]
MIRFFYFIIIIQLALSQSPLNPRYHTYQDVLDSLSSWQNSFLNNPIPSPLYPGSGVIFDMEQIGSSTTDALPIYAVKLSFNADQILDKPKVLILGQCHAEEILGVEISMEIIKRFLFPSLYIGDIQILRGVLNNVELWVVPTHNPEGLNVVHGWSENGIWNQDVTFRKNKTDTNDNQFFDYSPVGFGNDIDGVDLNRNYDFNWMFGDPLNALDGGCAGNPSYISNYDYYRGESKVSETEVQAIENFAMQHNFMLSIAYHSSRSGCVAERVIYPWEWDGEKKSPDFEVISSLGQEIAELIPVELADGNYHHAASSSRKGNAHDWFYSQTGCIQYLVEVGTENIQPEDEELIKDTIERNMQGAYHLLKRAAGINIGGGPDKHQITGIVRDQDSGQPLSGVEVEVVEMSSSILRPRLTNSFGRYRRLLYPGTFNLIFSKPGYETFTLESVSPSSSSITEIDISLIKLPEYSVTFNINAPYTIDSNLPLNLYKDDFYSSYQGTGLLQSEKVEIYSIENNSWTISWPEGSYKLILNGLDLYPEIIEVDLNEDRVFNLNLNWYDVLINESFNDAVGWATNDSWIIEESMLKSQSGLTYGNSISRIDLLEPFLDNNFSAQQLVIKIAMNYEFEWGNDFLSIDLFNESTNYNLLRLTDQRWNDSNNRSIPDYIYIDALEPLTNYSLSFTIEPDQTLGYRGIEMYGFQILQKTSDGYCRLGDFNHNGQANVGDIIDIVGLVLNSQNPTFFQYCVADLNDDSYIDIRDIVLLVNYLLEEN